MPCYNYRNNYNWRVTLKNIKVLLVIAIICVSSLCLVSCNSSVYATWDNYESYIVGGGNFSLDDITSISVDWISGDVQLVPAEVDTITVYEESKKEIKDYQKLRHYVSDGNLDIRFAAPGAKLINFDLAKTLYIQIPQGLEKNFTNINFDLVSTTSTITGITANNVDIDSVSGQITVNTCDFKIFDIISVSGGADITTCSVAGLKVKSVSGEVNVKNSEVTDFDIDSTSGNIFFVSTIMPSSIEVEVVSSDVRITLPENNGFTLDYDTVSGSISNVFATTTSGQGKYVYGDGTNTISIDSVSGNLTISRL